MPGARDKTGEELVAILVHTEMESKRAAEVGRPNSGALEPDPKLGPEFRVQNSGYDWHNCRLIPFGRVLLLFATRPCPQLSLRPSHWLSKPEGIRVCRMHFRPAVDPVNKERMKCFDSGTSSAE